MDTFLVVMQVVGMITTASTAFILLWAAGNYRASRCHDDPSDTAGA